MNILRYQNTNNIQLLLYKVYKYYVKLIHIKIQLFYKNLTVSIYQISLCFRDNFDERFISQPAKIYYKCIFVCTYRCIEYLQFCARNNFFHFIFSMFMDLLQVGTWKHSYIFGIRVSFSSFLSLIQKIAYNFLKCDRSLTIYKFHNHQ